MSAVFKNAKKKVSQIELRKFMNEHKNKLKVTVQKIDSPLAKYNENGQLTCVLCKSVVRSENVWKVHINAKQHKENVELAKKLKEETNNFQKAAKRPASPDSTTSNKKVKSILKNSGTTTNNIPDDFFDNKTVKKVEIVDKNDEKPTEQAAESKNSEVLPEGFFDDPKLDAKARHLEYKDPVEEEWEKFQKEIKEVDHKSAVIIAEDQEEATTERQIDEIEEQMRNWSRVLDLEQKKKVVTVQTAEETNMEISEEDEDAEDFDEFLDWRAKKSFM